ncbi:hypothetical protein CHLRE_02g105300v5 [Chlamydomonas reinhardtii]|uniref:Uncharacterized protein n=1 Tax=Chlamydomonas reinhardtii TaxID=3055 RepID=A8I471_CHLRE|nr:uncharacterized protein CHLRE_02g105300v5 [Chlamydomonas reinhardtii]PNW87017.1 hypothetical protein CHLRE_02g105300v5 [Chlamydomonas reinhardtii]|eukprot:XP_001699758.1 flagellar associated protein [Chlamydomonas reinhardtii]
MMSARGVAFSTNTGAPSSLAPGQAIFNDKGRLPAGLAAYRGSIDELDDLIATEDSKHAEAADLHNETPLHIAAQYGQFDVVKFLIREHSVNVDPVNWEGWTPFFGAISRSHIEIADFLLRNGADLHHTTPSGMSAMHIAAWFSQRDSIEYLLQKRAHLHKDNTYGIPPMGMARPGPIKRMMFNAQEQLDED